MRRYAAVVRAGYGVLLLLAPGAVVRTVSGGTADRASAAVGRVLGSRHLAQTLTIERAGTRGWLLIGTVIDAAHALSMVGLAALSRDHRRLAALDAALAAGLAINGLREARNA
jgi:hypothetical protein